MEQLLFAYELLDKAIDGINLNCMLTTLPNGSSVVDHCYAKVRMEKSYMRLKLCISSGKSSGFASR